MRQYYIHEYVPGSTKHSEHYSVGVNFEHNVVLVQLGDEKGEQIRLALNETLATRLKNLIDDAIIKLKKERDEEDATS